MDIFPSQLKNAGFHKGLCHLDTCGEAFLCGVLCDAHLPSPLTGIQASPVIVQGFLLVKDALLPQDILENIWGIDA